MRPQRRTVGRRGAAPSQDRVVGLRRCASVDDRGSWAVAHGIIVSRGKAATTVREMSNIEVEMHGGEGGVNPTAESIAALFAAHGDGPVHMLNLLKFREVADYPVGHEHEGSSGADAYGRYGEVALRNVGSLGGRLVLAGTFHASVIGDPSDRFARLLHDPDSSLAELRVILSPCL